MEYYELIEKFRNNELKGDALNEFKKMLSENDKLKKELDLANDVEEFLNDQDEFEFRNELKQIIAKQRKKHEKSIKSYLLSPVAKIAASVIIVIGLSIYLFILSNSGKNKRIFEKYYQPYEYTNAVRSVENTQTNKILQNALNAYVSKEYENAIVLFQEVLEEDSQYLIAELLMGISYIEQDKIEEAIRAFEDISSKDNYLLKETSNWYLGLSYLKNSDLKNAIEVFKRFTLYDNYYKEKAQKIIGKID